MFKFIQKAAGLMVLLTMALAACQPAPAPTPTAAPVAADSPTQPASPAFSDEDVKHIVALGKMKGHLIVSLPLWAAGEFELAAMHAGHPVEELFNIVADELKATNADVALKDALDGYATLAGAAGEAATVKAAHQAALDAVAAAEQSLVGALTGDLAFQGEVIHGLLERVEEEYAEAVSEGKIAELVEYQDALGFLAVAKEHYEAIEVVVKAEHPNEHEEIEEQFIKLEAAFPGATPPEQAVDPEEVEEHVDKIVAELREAVGLGETVARSPVEIVAAIREKVERSLEEYKEGKNDEAYELAAGAYLDGFEHLEGDLLSKDKELVETLETQFKDLRDGIKVGKPLADLETLAGEINANLDKAESLLK